MRDFAGIGYSIQILTRHIANNGDRLEITSTLEKHNMIVNGRKHIPSILKYRKMLNHLDDHPEDYGEDFFHKNELSPEDYSWMCTNEKEERRYGFNVDLMTNTVKQIEVKVYRVKTTSGQGILARSGKLWKARCLNQNQ
jgi:hypothetical protein